MGRQWVGSIYLPYIITYTFQNNRFPVLISFFRISKRHYGLVAAPEFQDSLQAFGYDGRLQNRRICQIRHLQTCADMMLRTRDAPPASPYCDNLLESIG